MISFLFFIIAFQLFQPAVAGQTTTEANAPQVVILEVGRAVDRELSGGQKQEFQIVLGEGQYARVLVEQQGIDVVVRLLGSNKKQITEFDEEIRVQGQEQVEWVSSTGGIYWLSVEAKGPPTLIGRYVIRLTEQRISADRDRLLYEARQQYTESVALRRAGKYDEALSSGNKAIKTQEELLGSAHPDVANSLNNLAFIYYLKGDHTKSELLHNRALEIRMRVLGPDHPHVAYSLNNLAALYSRRGEYSRAKLLFQRALEIKEKTQGPDHPDVASAMNNLASTYFDMGDYLNAEELHHKALKIRENALGPNHIGLTSSLTNIANLYSRLGDYQTAEKFQRRALEIRTKALGPEHADVATTLNNLGSIYFKMGDLAKAESMFQRAMEIREKALGRDHNLVATALNNLAEVYYLKADYTRAEQTSRRAFEIISIKLGPDHPELASTFRNLARVHHLRGDHGEAERLYQRALAIRENAQGIYHPKLATLLNDIAGFYAGTGNPALAMKAQARANSITERNLTLNLVTGSERQKLAYLISLSEITDRTVSLHTSLAPRDSTATELALSTILQRKGRVLDVMSNSLTMLRARFSAEDRKLLDQLNDTSAHLANLVLDGPARLSESDQQEIRSLQDRQEQLESEISRRSAGSYQKFQPLTLAAIRSAIPTGAALIEFAVYYPFDPKETAASAYGPPHYIAYIVRQQGEVEWKELGVAQTIDAAITAWRAALRDPRARNVRQLARTVDKRVMEPLRGLLGNTTQLLISPDGALNLIPFAALVDEQNKYLIQRNSFTYLTSGRDLLRMQIARTPKSKPVVIADPLFGDNQVNQIGSAKQTISRRQTLNRSVTNTRELSDVYFAQLPGTEIEANIIKTVFPEASVLARQNATETALKAITAPRLLHIATHGFFLEDSSITAGNLQTTTGNISSPVILTNPLLRSGLALAGANKRSAGGDDGILTALEASGLNLWGTKLVVLSACDTGVGQVRNGEGVYGLRRAFVLAGAESLVMSLWPASDYTTRRLMTDYYKNLKQGMGRGDALRQVQLNMLKRDPHLHPFYWANFIQAGDWSSL